jgi:uncharacterized metal-binding protein YceD (DUF177 family)
MKIPFIRIRDEVDIEDRYASDTDTVSIKGSVKPKNGLFLFKGALKGETDLSCDSCLEEYTEEIDESLELWFCDGEFRGSNDDGRDVIEFFDGVLDFDEVVRSEIESIRTDYHKCKNCSEKENLD